MERESNPDIKDDHDEDSETTVSERGSSNSPISEEDTGKSTPGPLPKYQYSKVSSFHCFR